jgi:transcriptional regulator with XRE-family HTH domain
MRQLPFVLVLPRTAVVLHPERLVMNGDKVDSSMNSIPSVSLFRGIYNRVAKRLGVDPSYVSRVARGERKSAVVEKALAEEVRIIRDHLNNHENNHNDNHNNHNNNHNNNHASADQKKNSQIKSRSGEPLEA